MRWIKMLLATLAVFLVGNAISDSSGPSSGYTGAPNETIVPAVILELHWSLAVANGIE